MALRTILVVWVLIATAFAFMVTSQNAAAAARTNLVIGLQNDMVNLNPFDPGTNSVWKSYQTEYNFESLFTYDPNYQIYADLADPAAACPTGTTVAVPGSCVDLSKLNITVNIRSGVTFTNGQPLTADDVVFTYQTLPWSTLATAIVQAIWWDTPKAPLWNSTANGGACSNAAKCVSHVGIFKTGNLQVRFQLTPHTVPGVTNGGYALVFYDTLVSFIIPRGIWKDHLQSTPQINYSDPALGNIKDSWDQSIDFSFGGPGQYDATVGTGPFYMTSWTRNAGSKSLVYGNYWGKSVAHTWAGTSYPFSPPSDGKHVTEFDFIVFGSLDVVSLALQQGTIDTLLWSLTPGFVNVVGSNPAITVQTVTDSGYFYLSFNTRVAPWNALCLRQAISMAIDKNYIVNTLMGGYGIPGYAPISIANPTYVNSSAQPIPGGYNQAGIDAKLNSCNYKIGPDGFYQTPTGQPIAATILTPPKDYDPVRADAGIMISNNLKSAHLNIDSAPTSFDTIVAKAFTRPVNFQIYVLGWSLGLFPETYLCTFFCSNYDVNKNPAGQNSAGYSNPTVDALINQALYTTDTTARTAIVKHIEGLVAADIPWNVLYYRKNVVAWRNDAWGGWVLYPNGNAQFNFYSVVNIKPASVQVTPIITGPLAVATSMPDQVFYRQTVPIGVYVSQNGAPVSGASVALTVQFGGYYANFTGTTGSTGKYSTTWTVPLIQGSGTATAQVTYKGLTATNAKRIESTIGPPMPSAQLALSTPTPVIPTGGTATITAKVTGSAGQPIASVPLTIETNLTAGGITPTAATTDSTGAATFTYTAPAATSFVNSQFTDIVRAHITPVVLNTIAAETQSAQIVIVTQNDAAPIWDIVSLAKPAVPTNFHVVTSASVPVVVNVTNFAGAAVANADVDPIFSDAWNFTVAPASAGSNKTDATGQARFTVTGVGLAANTTTMALTFRVRGVTFSTTDTILVNLATTTSTGFGGYMSVGSLAMPYAATPGSNSVALHLFDKGGAAASGVPAMFKVDYGDFGLPAQFAMNINYDCADTPRCPNYTTTGSSLDLNSFGQGSLGGSFQNSTGQGWNYGVENMINDYEVVTAGANFATGTLDGQNGVYYDACDAVAANAPVSGADPAPDPRWNGAYVINVTSATDSTGVFTLPFSINQEKKDSPVQVEAFVGSSGGATAVTVNACAFSSTVDNFAYHISTGLVTQRAPIFAAAQVTSSLPIVTSQQRVVSLRAQFKDLNGVVSKPVVLLTQGAGSAARNVLGSGGGTQTGSTAGWLNYSRTVCFSNAACSPTSAFLSLSQGLTFNYLPADTRYAYSGIDQLFAKAFISPTNLRGVYWLAPTFEALLAKLPMSTTIAYLYLPSTTAFLKVSLSNDLVSVGGTTTATVTVYSSLTGTTQAGANVWIGNQQTVTNATGVATLTVSPITLGAQDALVVATTSYGGAARGWYALVASNPVLTYANVAATAVTAGTASTITVSATNTLAVPGNATVWLAIDGQNVTSQVVSFAASETKTVTFTYPIPEGAHTVSVGSSSTSVTISSPTLPVYLLAIGLLVAGLVVGVVVGTRMGRKRKGPPTSMPEESGGGMGGTAEEELSPEDKL